jgi:hypothetical protein
MAFLSFLYMRQQGRAWDPGRPQFPQCSVAMGYKGSTWNISWNVFELFWHAQACCRVEWCILDPGAWRITEVFLSSDESGKGAVRWIGHFHWPPGMLLCCYLPFEQDCCGKTWHELTASSSAVPRGSGGVLRALKNKLGSCSSWVCLAELGVSATEWVPDSGLWYPSRAGSLGTRLDSSKACTACILSASRKHQMFFPYLNFMRSYRYKCIKFVEKLHFN